MEDTRKKGICPLLSSGTEALIQCRGEACEWFRYDKCCVWSIPDMLHRIDQVLLMDRE